jgi:nicotinamide phosphoribosyltransferase
MAFTNNLILNTDAYKASMYRQYPKGTTNIYSYIESRGGEFDYTLFFGLQMFIKQYLLNPITEYDVEHAANYFKAMNMPFNYTGWHSLVKKHKGKLPVSISAVPEGSIIPTKNVLLTIENTDEEFFWLTTWLETMLLRAIWYPTTVATLSHSIKQNIYNYLKLSGTPEFIYYKLHDFGARGVSSLESANIGGVAHLVNFNGTDTASCLPYANASYGHTQAFSCPASEHSTITSWGREGELAAYDNMINEFAGNGIFACVSDSYDIYHACSQLWGTVLKDKIIKSGAMAVIRPDSGEPVATVRQVIRRLSDKFGYTVNEKGYKVLNNVRVLQGDGVNAQAIHDILENTLWEGYSADNIAFGMGGALLQIVNRDTLKFAMKCSAAKINGKWAEVYKDPITDSGKTSKRGRLALTYSDEFGYKTCQEREGSSILKEVYRDGRLLVETTMADIRVLSEKSLEV